MKHKTECHVRQYLNGSAEVNIYDREAGLINAEIFLPEFVTHEFDDEGVTIKSVLDTGSVYLKESECTRDNLIRAINKSIEDDGNSHNYEGSIKSIRVQKFVTFDKDLLIDYVDDVQWLMHESGVTMYRVSKETGINPSQLSRIKSGEYELENLTIRNGLNLQTYARNLRKEEQHENQKQ